MNLSISTVYSEDMMHTTKLKCYCGRNAELQMKAKLGRVRDQIVTVFNVPVYTCSCGNAFMDGPDCRTFAKRVSEAVEKRQETIYF